MPRICLPVLSVTDNRIVLAGEKAHYLFSVLRCKKGDELTIFDGKGNCILAVIETSDKREVIAEVLRHFPCDFESPVHIILVQGLLKGEKMDWVIQKATELGVREIIPVITERSQVRQTR
jgi:16S rRNA (uracil1498-N3)-methyltransferase